MTMLTNEEKLKIELLRQKYFNRADKLRLYRKCESPKFNEFEFGKVIGQIKAINDVMSILGYNKKDIDTGINNAEDNTEDIENEFE